jgi:hypothetical protein
MGYCWLVREETRGRHQPSVALKTMTGAVYAYEPRHAMSGISPLRTLTWQPVPVGRPELGRRMEATLAVWAMAVSMHGGDTTAVGGVGEGDTWHTVGAGIEREGGRTPLVRGWSPWCLGRV